MNEVSNLGKGIRAIQKEARPREILEAAFQEFALRGYAATNLEDIAKRVGVTKGTIYVYFKNKEFLFEKMIEELTQPNIDIEYYRTALDGKPAIEVLGIFISDLYTKLVSNEHTQEIVRFLIAEARLFESIILRTRESLVLPSFQILREILEEGVARKEFVEDASRLSPAFILSPILGLNVMQRLDPEISPFPKDFLEEHIRALTRLLVR